MEHHFVVVHGGLHGAWCRWKLMDRLQKAGQKVTAVDLTGAGQHPADPDTIFTFEEYNKPVVDLFETIPERLATALPSLCPHFSIFNCNAKLCRIRNRDVSGNVALGLCL